MTSLRIRIARSRKVALEHCEREMGENTYKDLRMALHRMIFIDIYGAQLLAQGGGKSAGGRRNTGGCIRQGLG